MNLLKSVKSVISPFLEGIARNLDFAGSIDDSPGPPLKDNDAIISDWQMVGSDYNNSLIIINEELHGTKEKSEK
jgi:hypothetical protein